MSDASFLNLLSLVSASSEEEFMAQQKDIDKQLIQQYVTDKQLAVRFCVSRQWVWAQAKRNADFPQPIKLSSGCTRFSKTDIEKFENGCAKQRQLASKYGRLKTIA